MKPLVSQSPSLGSVRGGDSKVTTLNTGLGRSDYHLPYFVYITTPKNTAQSSPMTTILDMPIGVIDRIWIEFPKGCSGLTGFQIYKGVQQVFPFPAGVWFRSDNSVLNFAFTCEMLVEPFTLECLSYNLDDTYNHTIWIGLEMSGKPSDLPPQLAGLINYLRGA